MHLALHNIKTMFEARRSQENHPPQATFNPFRATGQSYRLTRIFIDKVLSNERYISAIKTPANGRGGRECLGVSLGR